MNRLSLNNQRRSRQGSRRRSRRISVRAPSSVHVNDRRSVKRSRRSNVRFVVRPTNQHVPPEQPIVVTLRLVNDQPRVATPVVAQPPIQVADAMSLDAPDPLPTVIEAEQPVNQAFVARIKEVFETYLGIADDDLATTAWKIAEKTSSFQELKENITKSSLNTFKFPDEFIYDIWGVADDFRRGRIDDA